MTISKELIAETDLSTRYLMFFLELCKSGAVVLDMNREDHSKILTMLTERVMRLNPANYPKESEAVKADIQSKFILCSLILTQLMKNSISKKEDK